MRKSFGFLAPSGPDPGSAVPDPGRADRRRSR